ncbi:MAG: glycine zipper domain-containing protein [Gemmataceae bacterium]|nr:glycine zipper domain-containing protein [Gemmataceae bacterium]
MRTTTTWFGTILLCACGCSSMNHTERGAVGGGVIGGLAGAAIGSATGNAGAGAAIGAGSGAILGGLVGNAEDRHERRVEAWAARNALTVNDVVQMSQRQVGDELIINQIYNSSTAFNLSSQDVIYLREQGVSERVISAMQARRGYRVVRPAGVVYVDPPPPPAFHVGVGFGHHCGPRW